MKEETQRIVQEAIAEEWEDWSEPLKLGTLG